ncbi:TspO/MBR family protein [Holospora obtusa]|nr:TspO/MBR family protein [Holospora obtusa]
MNQGTKNHLSLIIWIAALIAIGGVIGSLTKPEISTWYSTLNRSALTPPNYVFPVAWTILYGIIGACGWTPLFFHYHLTRLSLLVLVAMDILVVTIIWLAYKKMRAASLLMIPYLSWILFASYLNFYIWQYN